MKRILPSLLVVFAAITLAACGHDAAAPLPKPPKVPVLPTTTTLADTSNVQLQKVGGTTTTIGPSGLGGGRAVIQGKTTLNGAPAGGAVVRVERYDRDAIAGSKEITSNADGGYRLDGLVGGRYRLRAFRSPDAAMAQAQVFFLGSSDTKNTDLGMAAFGNGLTINASASPSPPILGTSATLTVSVSTRGVDGAGVARSIPSAGVPVQVTTAGGRSIISANPNNTGANGRATFTFSCNALDRQGITVAIPGGAPTAVSVSACELPPTTTTSTILDPNAPTTLLEPGSSDL